MVPSSAMSSVGGLPWPETDATHYHAQLELPDKGHAIKKFIGI